MATSVIKSLNSILATLQTPLNTSLYCISAGFNTGSGNYFDFFYPCHVDTSKNYTVTLTGHSIIYADSRKNSGMSATAEVLNKYSNGLMLELSFTEPQTANISGVFYGGIRLNVAS
jgi:hypothetical protein